MRVELEVVSGDMRGKIFEFEEPRGFIFGRAPDCDCIVDKDPTFSRHHFLLEINPPNVMLKDLGSLNGTYVNDIKYGGRPKDVAPENAKCSEPIALRDGDYIKSGYHELVLRIEGPTVCVDCGKEIPSAQRKAAEFVGGSYLCADCRRREEEKQQFAKKAKEPLRIKLAPEEIKLSIDQRMKAEKDPAAVIEEIIKLFLAAQGKEETPEIQGYNIEQKLGQGGFGAVYAAIRVTDGKKIALKTMLQTRKPDKKQLLMFEREQQIAKQLRHPNIVHCEKVSQWKDIHFIEMEYMGGGSVGDCLARKGKLSLDEAASIMIQALEGLAYAHKAKLILDLITGQKEVKGVVHRDLKPPNILLTGNPGKWIAKISDFGLAKAFAEAGMTKGSITIGAGTYCGTPYYMAPEHLINYRYVKPSTDVFEIAATFYHMLTGMLVWDPKCGDIFKTILEGRIKPIREVERSIPKKVAESIDHALSRNPKERFENAGKFLESLKKSL